MNSQKPENVLDSMPAKEDREKSIPVIMGPTVYVRTAG